MNLFLKRVVNALAMIWALVAVWGMEDGEAAMTGNLEQKQVYTPCYPIPQTDVVNSAIVAYTTCGDQSVGNQSLWWLAVEPDQQCFGMSMPARRCSRSMTNEFHCLVGPEWDSMRSAFNFPSNRRDKIVSVEMGNWLTATLAATAGRIVLEEMMDFQVALVARVGSEGAYERAARHHRYAILEVWEDATLDEARDYYVWGDVYSKPFKTDSNKVVWAATGQALPDQPATSDLRTKTLAVKERSIRNLPLGISGKLGIFVTRAAIVRQESNEQVIADYWRGHLQSQTLEMFPRDGTVTCQQRLKAGTDCADPKRTYHCPSQCPHPRYGGTQASCCINGKFYPPQCVPEGVTYDEIARQPDWASPNCREMLHVDPEGLQGMFEAGHHEAVLVNLKLNYTITYVGHQQIADLLLQRTRDNVPTLFAWWKPDHLVSVLNAKEVVLPPANASVPTMLAVDPLHAEGLLGFPVVQLKKLVQFATQTIEPDFYQFVRSFDWTDQSMDELLRLHMSAGGALNVEEAACAWVKANSNIWSRWVSNDNVHDSGGSSRLVLMVTVAVLSAFVFVACALLIIMLMLRQKSRDLYLKWEDIAFTNPPTVIGTGAKGDVLKGTYRGMTVAVKPMTLPPTSEPSRRRLSSVLASFRAVSLNGNPLSRANLVRRRGSLNAERLPTQHAQVSQDWVQVPERRRATIDGAGPFWRQTTQTRGSELPLLASQRMVAEWSPRHRRPSWMQARAPAPAPADSRRSTMEALLPAIPTPNCLSPPRSAMEAPASDGVTAVRPALECGQALDATLVQSDVLQSASTDLAQVPPDMDAPGASVGTPEAEEDQRLLTESRRSTMEGWQLSKQTPSRLDSRRSTMRCFPGMDAESFQAESRRSTMRSFPAHDQDDSRRSTAESLRALQLMSMQASSRRSTMEGAQLAAPATGATSRSSSFEQHGRRPIPLKAPTLGKSPLSIPVDCSQSPGRIHFPEAEGEFNRRETWHGGTTRSMLGIVAEGGVSETEDRMQGKGGAEEVRLEITEDDENNTQADGHNNLSPPSSQSRSETNATLLREGRMLLKIRNPYLISCYGLTVEPSGKVTYLVTEWMQDSLHELIHNPTFPLDQQVLFSIIKNIAAGMNYLHSMDPPVLHGNLTAANVLLDKNLTAKVAEFGLSCKIWQRKSFGVAPEIVLGTVNQATKAQDVFSFGTLVYEVLMRVRPPEVNDAISWRAHYESGEYKALELSAAKCADEELRALVVRCQAWDPVARPSFEEINRILQSKDDSYTISQLMRGLTSKKRLLDDILPPKIGEMLAQGLKVKPEHFKCVTIFFSDIVGFTTISSTQPPEMVMAMLDRLYAKFDELAKKHQLFKVETIGDAYMAVGNLSTPQADHAERVAMFAMDCVEAAQQTPVSLEDPSLGSIQIRCGFHSGPVVASVVGTTNPRYCLFGDTVNVANRMESTSEANCIHLSHQASITMNALKNVIPLVYRGCRNIKGKGDMHTFWIFGYHPQAQSKDPGVNNSPKRRSTFAGLKHSYGSKAEFRTPLNYST